MLHWLKINSLSRTVDHSISIKETYGVISKLKRGFPLLLILIFLLPSYLWALKSNPFNSISSETIYVINHDSQGRLIIGSDEGLYLYNGYELQSLLNRSEEVLYLQVGPDDFVFPEYYSGSLELLSLNEGEPEYSNLNRILSGHYDEGYRYTSTSKSFTHEILLSKDNTSFILLNLKGEITQRFDVASFKDYTFRRALNLWGEMQFLTCHEPSGEIIFQQGSRGVAKSPGIGMEEGSGNIIQVNDSTIAVINESNIDSLVYLVLDKDMNLVSRRSQELEYQVRNLCIAEDGVFITYNGGGFEKYDLEFHSTLKYSPEQTVNYVHEFRGDYFVGTLDEGLQVIEDAANQISVLQHFSADRIRCFLPSTQGISYYGQNNGQHFIALGDSLIWSGNMMSHKGRINHPISKLFWYNSTLFADRYFLVGDSQNPSQDIGAMTTSKMIFQSPDSIGSFKSMTIFNDELWICHHIGLTRISAKNGAIQSSNLLDIRIHSIKFLDIHKALVVLRDGPYIFDLASKSLQKLSEISRSVSTIRDLYIDHQNGYTYIASHNGLFRYPTKSLNHKNSADVVASELELLLEIRTEKLIHKDSFLYAMHSQSITQIDLQNEHFSHYDQDRGLPDGTFQDMEVFDGHIYLATLKEVYSFPIQKAFQDQQHKVELAGVHTNRRRLKGSATYIFQPAETTIKFLLTNSLWHNSKHLHYEFRLPGHQEEWVRIDQAELTFYDLPPQKYLLQLRLINKAKRKSESQVENISFAVVPHLWQTAWFKSSIVALAGILLFLFLFIRDRRARKAMIKELNYERVVSDLRFKMVRAQINPHFIFNCLNSISLLNFRKQHEKVGHYIHLFSKMIKFNLTITDIAFHKVKEEIEYLNDYLALENLRFKDQLLTTLSVSDRINIERAIPCFFVQIFAENSIKHGRKTDGLLKVSIRFELTNQNALTVIIEDDGDGFSQSDGHGIGIGLQLIHDRIKIYKKKYNCDISLSQTNKPGLSGTITSLIFENEPS